MDEAKPGLLARLFSGMSLREIVGACALLATIGGGTWMKHDADESAHDDGELHAAVFATVAEMRGTIDSLRWGLAIEKRHRRALERKVYRGQLPTLAELYGPPEPKREKKKHWWQF